MPQTFLIQTLIFTCIFCQVLCQDCSSDACFGVKKRPVCGTDGVTYVSRCEVKRLHDCEGRSDLSVQSKGACPERTKCLTERKTALATAGSSTAVYIPECMPDGSFAEVQCHESTRYCWCVNEDGKPIKGTSTSMDKGKPGCRKHTRRSNKDRKRGCATEDRIEFNKNIIRVFSEEYDRVPKPPKSPSRGSLPISSQDDSVLDTQEKRVAAWKFSVLDTDKDGRLKSRETRSLQKMVKKYVKPKSCARKFIKNCDSIEKDKYVSREEWFRCLGLDDKSKDIDTMDQLPSDATRTSRKDPVRSGGPSLWEKQLDRGRPKQDEKDRDDKPKSCLEEKATAIKMDKSNPKSSIFIPRCAPDGKFTKAQCHTSTGYCWCVDEITGKPIPGISTHKVEPNCDDIKVERPLKGCPHSKKRQFVTEVVDKMTTEMVKYANGNSTDKSKMPDQNPEYSLEERVIRWKLKMLDRNRNNMIDRGELRAFKKEFRRNKARSSYSRRCGRNFVSYCDEDQNNKITVQELIDCLGVNEPTRAMPPKRRGQNPFMHRLT